MPLDPDFLAMLICPETAKPLRPATAAELEAVNALVRDGRARNRGGEAVTEPLQEGLVPEGTALLYPVRDGIPILLRQEAIAADEVVGAGGPS